MQTVFVVNPMAGTAETAARLRVSLAALNGRPDCRVVETAAAGDGLAIARDLCAALPAGESLRLVACGGDGTLHEVIGGIMAAGAGQRVSVSCCPCGSGNDFVRSFGGAERFLDPEKLLHAPERPLDLLRVGKRYAHNAVHFGLDSVVAEAVNAYRDRHGRAGKTAYTRGVLKALVWGMDNRFTVTVDGEALDPEGHALLCTLANGQYVGGNYRCAPRAKTDDGLMEICLVKPISRLRFARLMGSYQQGTHLENPAMRPFLVYRRAALAQVEAPEGFCFSMDGEIVRENRFTVEVLPGALRFACPEA